MKGLAHETRRLSKSLDALGALTDRLAKRKTPPQRTRTVADDEDLFKAMPTQIQTSAGIESAPWVGTPTPRPSSGIANFSATRSDTFKPATSKPAASPSRGTQASSPYTAVGRNTEKEGTSKAGEETAQLPRTRFGGIAPMVGKRSRLTLLKYSEDQPRDERGRWTAGGVATAALATLGGAALLGGGAFLALHPTGRRLLGLGGGGAAARASRFRQVRVRPIETTRPATAVAVKPAKAPKASARDTKPFSQLSARQQARRIKAVQAAAIARGATPTQAAALAAQMRTAATGASSTATAAGTAAAAAATAGAAASAAGARRALTIRTPTKPAVPLTTDMVMRERARVDAMKDKYDAMFARYNAVQSRKTDHELAVMNRAMDKLRDQISRQEASLVARYGTWNRTFKPR